MDTELKADSIGLPTDLVAKDTPAPREEDERQSLDVLEALSAKAGALLAGAVNTLVNLTERRRAEETLHESEARFRMLADNISQLAWTCDLFGNVTWYNKRWLDYTGLTFEDMRGWNWSKVQHPDHLDRVVLRVKRSAETGEPWEDTFPLRGKDGEYRWFLSRAMPIRDKQGNIRQWFGTNTDVTEQMQAEEALRESEGRLSAELAAAQQLQRFSVELFHEQDVQTLYDKLVDAAAAIMRSDCASMQMLHPERGDKGELRLLAARGFNTLATEVWEWVRADYGCSCGMALSTKERAIVTDVETCDFMAGTQHRATYLQAGIHAAQSTPLLSRSGRLLGMLSTHWREPHEPSETDLQRFDVLARQAADLIERAQAEEALREREERLSAIFGQATAGFATTDTTGRFIMANERYCEIVGRSREDVLQLRMHDITHPDDLAKNAPLFERAAEDGQSFDIEKRYVRPDGSSVWVNNSVFPVRGAAGHIEGVTAVCIDVSKRKRAEEALRESEELYRGLFNSAPAGVFVCGRSGLIQAYNARAAELWGRQPVCGDPNELYCGSLRRRLPSGDALPHAQDVTAEVLRTGVARQNVEVIIERPDGSQISVLVSCAPLKSAQGEVTGAITSFVDISERKRGQEQQRLLLREMNHRVKNLFALAGGVVALSARSATTPKDLAKAVQERLAALARAHELMLPGLAAGGEKANRPATLAALVRTIICPHVAEEDARVAIAGPDVPIDGTAVTSLALLLHEFATNAAKYGALSTKSGRIDVSWTVWKGELLLAWRERGGPPIDGPPESEDEGFGSSLARLTVAGQLGGEISSDWNAEGLTVNLSIPLDRLAIS